MERLGGTLWRSASSRGSVKMEAFLLSMKDERVNNVLLEFHIILIIFEILVELAI